jgi:hypothetical protein
MRLRFGDCVFDADARQVIRAERPVAVSPKAFELLGLLISSRPNAISKAQIQDRLGPTFTFPPRTFRTSSASCAPLSATRLGSQASSAPCPASATPFAHPPEPKEPRGEQVRGQLDAVYTLVWGTREIALDPGTTSSVGGREALIWIDDASVSRRHARISIGPSGATIEDLGSKNGTYVGGRKLHKPSPLVHRDVVTIGPATLTLRVLRHSGSTRTAVDKIRK